MPARQRGFLRLGRFTLFTTYPLGLFRAWSNSISTYTAWSTRSRNRRAAAARASKVSGEGGAHGEGSDDFAGLRPYHTGDSLRHVAWKAFARGEQMLTKQFAGRAGSELWLDWDALPA